MSRTVALLLKGEVSSILKSLGARNLYKCYQCGTCTAACPLSEEITASFRKAVKYAQLGLEEKIAADPAPWLCYACGECSEMCPKDAKPTEILAALRRYSIIKYDWTGFSKRFYLSKTFELMSIAILSILTALIVYLFKGPVITERVDLSAFAQPTVAIANVIVFGFLSLILLINIYRMYKFTTSQSSSSGKLPVSTYIAEFIKIIPYHFLTQRLMARCRDGKYYYTIHLLLFYGYAVIFVHHILRHMLLPLISPTLYLNEVVSSIVGISAFVALILGSSLAIYGRIKKSTIIWEYSHPTDWVFITLLWLTSITGLLTDIFKYSGLPLPTYVTFTVHLMFVVPLLVLEVPFAKWSHLAYRPFALYFNRLNEIKQLRYKT